MKVIYDPETYILNLILREKTIAESDELKEGIIIDYDHEGKIVSIEILDASEHIAEPKSIQYELKETKRVV